MRSLGDSSLFHEDGRGFGEERPEDQSGGSAVRRKRIEEFDGKSPPHNRCS